MKKEPWRLCQGSSYLRILFIFRGSFRLAFQSAQKLREPGDKLVAMIHYPPFNGKKEPSVFTEMFEKNGVDCAVYGHLHRAAGGYPFVCEREGVRYLLTSCDLLDFRLARVY